MLQRWRKTKSSLEETPAAASPSSKRLSILGRGSRVLVSHSDIAASEQLIARESAICLMSSPCRSSRS